MQLSQSLKYQAYTKESVYLKGSQRRRWKDKPQIHLPKGGKNTFFINMRVETTYILMKRVEKPGTVHEEEGECTLSKHICTIYPIFILRQRLNIRMRQNSVPGVSEIILGQGEEAMSMLQELI